MNALHGNPAWVRRHRRIGPLGTAGRIAGGSLIIAVAIAVEGLRAWDVAGALVVLPLIATLAAALIRAAHGRHAPSSLDRGHTVFVGAGFTLLAIVVGVASALTFATPLNAGAIWIFFGVSMLVAAARGDDGCEVLALPNAITGREDRVGCLIYSPIDKAEARRRRQHAEGQGHSSD